MLNTENLHEMVTIKGDIKSKLPFNIVALEELHLAPWQAYRIFIDIYNYKYDPEGYSPSYERFAKQKWPIKLVIEISNLVAKTKKSLPLIKKVFKRHGGLNYKNHLRISKDLIEPSMPYCLDLCLNYKRTKTYNMFLTLKNAWDRSWDNYVSYGLCKNNETIKELKKIQDVFVFEENNLFLYLHIYDDYHVIFACPVK